MVWIELPPPPIIKKIRKHAVTLSVPPAGGRYIQMIHLTVRCDAMQVEVGSSISDWWKHDAFISVMMGHGDHAGSMRVMPGNSTGYKLTSSYGTGKVVNPPRLRVPLPMLPARGLRQVAVEYDFSDDWLEIKLPNFNAATVEKPK